MVKKNPVRVLRTLGKTLDRNTALASQAGDPFRVLISTMLSHRTKDAKTSEAAEALFGKYPNAKALADAPEAEIRRLIKPVGFYRVKARRVKQAARIVIGKFGGVVPRNAEKLTEIPGVGRKTAACVINYGFGLPAIAVDTHVHRISNRLGWVKTKKPEETEKALEKIIPREKWAEVNDLLVRFGQAICKPVGPRCRECPVSKECDYYYLAFLKSKHG